MLLSLELLDEVAGGVAEEAGQCVVRVVLVVAGEELLEFGDLSVCNVPLAVGLVEAFVTVPVLQVFCDRGTVDSRGAGGWGVAGLGEGE